MDLYIYDTERQFTGLLESYEYLRWTRRYGSCGGFELRAIASHENIDALKPGHIIWKNDDREAAFIEYRELMTEDEREYIVARGRFASTLLARRIVWGTEYLNGDLSEVVRQLLTNHLISPAIADRAIGGFRFASPLLGSYINTQISYRNLLTAVEELCLQADVGFMSVWGRHAKAFTFLLYRGAVSQAVFSHAFENLNRQTFIRSDLDYRNVALVGGMGEGSDRVMQIVGDNVGEERRELFVDARDLQDNNSTADYAAILSLRGNAKLAEKQAVLFFDAEINPHGNLVYKSDFDLGQIVRVTSDRWGTTIDTRITEIEESYDRDGRTIQVTFGKGLLTLGQKL